VEGRHLNRDEAGDQAKNARALQKNARSSLLFSRVALTTEDAPHGARALTFRRPSVVDGAGTYADEEKSLRMEPLAVV
jgi:hypothetical protein